MDLDSSIPPAVSSSPPSTGLNTLLPVSKTQLQLLCGFRPIFLQLSHQPPSHQSLLQSPRHLCPPLLNSPWPHLRSWRRDWGVLLVYLGGPDEGHKPTRIGLLISKNQKHKTEFIQEDGP
ncbi:hypothetical protein CHARACLAT_020091 [Characodon lateralis]|uniref:Uncharacterized protein n=1 Tax=Characodon lateralis TaxID=208331 RepID=A0ABU7CSR0_9TELE|nr:hypothetical protein [Characodon lateralis]